jgi:hypothetical protein
LYHQNPNEKAILHANISKMKANLSPKILCFIVALLINGILVTVLQAQRSDTLKQQGIKFTGLTQTLTNLLKARSPKSIIVGAYKISLEDLIDDDIEAVFDCDSVISQYLAEAGDGATYGMLSYEMSRTMESRFVYDEGYLYVNIFSDTTAEGMYFNISIIRGKPVTIPVVLHTSDTGFSTSFDTTITVVFNADIDLFVNAAQAIADSQSRATRVRINTFTFEITSNPEEDFLNDDCSDSEPEEVEEYSAYIENSPKFIPFEIKGKQYCAIPRCFSIYAKTYWYLNPTDTESIVVDEGESYTLSFEQIERGDFIWEESYFSSLRLDLVMLPVDEDWDSIANSDSRATFQYVVDDLFDETSLEQITLCCDFWVIEGTDRSKKFVFKP